MMLEIFHSTRCDEVDITIDVEQDEIGGATRVHPWGRVDYTLAPQKFVKRLDATERWEGGDRVRHCCLDNLFYKSFLFYTVYQK